MRTAWISVIGAALLGAACNPSEQPTFEDFRALTFQEPETGIFITNGDEPVETLEELHTYYERYLGEVRDAELRHEGRQFEVSALPLIVNTVNGNDDRWPVAQAQNLTYCINKKAFGSNYAAVVSAMSSAAGEWEATANVNFVHASQYDASGCTSRNTNVVFDVQSVCRRQYLARAFFPSTSRKGREVMVDCTSFGSIAPWTLSGVLRHELGHTIGFRHEHTRPESGTCFEDNSWRALTSYDSSSVMHYPQCNGTQKGDLVLTNLDQQGARALYP